MLCFQRVQGREKRENAIVIPEKDNAFVLFHMYRFSLRNGFFIIGITRALSCRECQVATPCIGRCSISKCAIIIIRQTTDSSEEISGLHSKTFVIAGADTIAQRPATCRALTAAEHIITTRTGAEECTSRDGAHGCAHATLHLPAPYPHSATRTRSQKPYLADLPGDPADVTEMLTKLIALARVGSGCSFRSSF